jgi:Putative zinc-finger
MDCRAFREQHGDWVDDVLDPHESERLDSHMSECAACSRFDTLARRALMVARNAPPIELSADFSARLAARIADERRARIARHSPSRAERRSLARIGNLVWVRRAAAVAAVVGGSMVVRSAVLRTGVVNTASLGSADSSSYVAQDAMSMLSTSTISAMPGFQNSGEIVVVRSMRPVGGALLPLSDDPLLDGSDRIGMGDARSTTVAATAPLWPTAQMAAYAANRFAAMEFGDVMPVSVMHTQR